MLRSTDAKLSDAAVLARMPDGRILAAAARSGPFSRRPPSPQHSLCGPPPLSAAPSLSAAIATASLATAPAAAAPAAAAPAAAPPGPSSICAAPSPPSRPARPRRGRLSARASPPMGRSELSTTSVFTRLAVRRHARVGRRAALQAAARQPRHADQHDCAPHSATVREELRGAAPPAHGFPSGSCAEWRQVCSCVCL